MNASNSYSSESCIHIGGLNQGVTLCDWSTFINNNSFKGVYRPRGGIDFNGRLRVVKMGRQLSNEDLGYTPFSQIEHDVTNIHELITPDKLLFVRCDGVVEYCYEYYGYRIYGNDQYWNITKGGVDSMMHHSGWAVTPKSQAQDYMTLVQSSRP